jgi:hypothetical protein
MIRPEFLSFITSLPSSPEVHPHPLHHLLHLRYPNGACPIVERARLRVGLHTLASRVGLDPAPDGGGWLAGDEDPDDSGYSDAALMERLNEEAAGYARFLIGELTMEEVNAIIDAADNFQILPTIRLF